MSYLSRMEDYLRHESSHDRLPEAYKVREIYNEKVEQLEKERDELRARWNELFNYVTLKDFPFQERIIEKMEELEGGE